MKTFDLNTAVSEWKKIMRRSPSIDEADLAELERYLRDKADDLTRQGLGPEEAFRKAEEEFRRAGALEAAYDHVRSARPRGRFPWRRPRLATGLVRSYVLSTLRRLRLQKAHGLINIGGLALGLTACLLAFFWVQDEISYDRFQPRADSIAQVYNVFSTAGTRRVFTGSHYPLAATLKSECPEVLEAARVQVEEGLVIRHEDRVFNTDAVALADPSIFKVFAFSFLRGTAERALADKFAIVITESMARKYFGDRDPIGRTLRVNGQFDVQVSAVIQDIPAQSSLRFDAIAPFLVQFAPDFKEPTEWGGNPFETWVLLAPGADRAAVERKITAVAAPHFADAAAPGSAFRMDFRLHPLLRKRLYSPEGNSLIGMVLMFCVGAFLLLLLAGVNFTNLSTAAAAARTKEIGIRKTVGARRSDLVRQFLGESVGTAFLALGAALGLLALVLPTFNRVAGKSLEFGAIFRPSTLLGFMAITVLTGIAAGVYPALRLSSFPAKEVLAGRAASGSRDSAGLRKALVVFQFALSLILMVGTAVVGRQIAFIKAKDLGFERRGLVVVRMGPALIEGFDAFRAELQNRPGIGSVTAGLQNPMNISSTVFGEGVDWAGKDPASQVTLNWDYVDYDYFETLKAPFVAGRSFSRDFPSDIQGAFVINETAAKLMGLRDPVGQRMRVFKKEGPIVGVVKDFHFRPLRQAIEPIVFRLRPSARSWAFIRIAAGAEGPSLRAIADALKKIDPETLYQPVFFDEMMLNGMYEIEQKIWTVSSLLTAIAVLIASVGLFGLALFLTRQRTKEIGIRKVLGASSAGLTAKLTLDFLVWVGLAAVLASPLAYWLASRILGMYAYRSVLGVGIFVLSGLAMLGLAALTVGLQTLRAARANPVKSLRYE